MTQGFTKVGMFEKSDMNFVSFYLCGNFVSFTFVQSMVLLQYITVHNIGMLILWRGRAKLICCASESESF